MFIIFYGLAGTGKSYIGKKFAEYFQLSYLEADLHIPEAMHSAIVHKQEITQTMVDEFVNHLAAYITENFGPQPQNLIVSQALYRQVNRDYLKQCFSNVKFVEVQAPEDVIITRLRERGDWVDEQYAQSFSEHFQGDASNYVIINDIEGDEKLHSQFNSLYELCCT